MGTSEIIYGLAGTALVFSGVGSVVYGMINKDIETILGGFALAYGGFSISGERVATDSCNLQLKRLDKIASELEKIAKNQN